MCLVTLSLILGAIPLASARARAQTTPQPTPPPGTNSILFNSATSEYSFTFDGKILYKYSIMDSLLCWQTGATFHALKAVSQNGNEFLPSQVGGISALFLGEERYPWDNKMTFKRLDAGRVGDTVRTRWRMKVDNTDSIEYTYRFHISGRTLVIRVQVENQSTRATGLQLDRCDNFRFLEARIVRVPYLTLFNVLYLDGSFTSMFLDWETTHASELRPSLGRYSSTSVWYAQVARYNAAPGGTRHPLKETVYLTVSPNLADVLPNLAGPVAPMKDRASSNNVLSFAPAYCWSFPRPECEHSLTYNYWDSLHTRGVRNLAVILKTWQRLGPERGFPNVLPANAFPGCSSTCADVHDPGTNTSGNVLLRTVLNHIAQLHYPVALHENYMDYYEEAGSAFTWADCARDQRALYLKGYTNTDCQPSRQARILKPSRVERYAEFWSGRIKKEIYDGPPEIGPLWSYLDAHSAYNPSDRVDYDPAMGDSAGMFLYTLKKYRALAGVLRGAYDGPVQGEGGNHFLYAGYFDDFEARIQTGDDNVFGYRAPLLVDFDLLKIRPKSALHGVGHYSIFFADSPYGMNKAPINKEQVLEFVATELAYSHGGLATKDWFVKDHSIDQAVLEYDHVFPVYQATANAMPQSIEYWFGSIGPLSASAYIERYPSYFEHGDPQFMSRVKVTYDNGVVVCVNRSSSPWDVEGIGAGNGWCTQNTVGLDTPQAGPSAATSFTLKARSGWVCYIPPTR
jgi:hypothetical protein